MQMPHGIASYPLELERCRYNNLSNNGSLLPKANVPGSYSASVVLLPLAFFAHSDQADFQLQLGYLCFQSLFLLRERGFVLLKR
jgi:hypothetical protein